MHVVFRLSPQATKLQVMVGDVLKTELPSDSLFCHNIAIPADFDIKEKVVKILEETSFDKKRARTMDIDDFLALLNSFNKDGFHFS
ncbi:probable dimethyladenosine transferase [Haliotis rufescens]|uniref:probable dimethyladenosine transferase n=1 Tax=Haliotis rufescens TaxID=6454 RepID=UPI00201FAC83|nr:probable dimethyladenosine transferase [Haliotis rufescens]